MYEVLKMKTVAENINDLTYSDYFFRLMLLARSVFKWEGLPPYMNERYIERYLFSEGKCMFYKDEKIGFVVARCTMDDGVNHYDDPTKLSPISSNGVLSGTYKNNKECVLIRNNDIMMPTSPTISLYACRLAETQRTIDLNVIAQRTPVLIKCSEKQRLTLKNIYKQWRGNEPVIYGDKSLDNYDFTVLNTNAPIVFDKLQIQKHSIWNEVMTFLGVNNANMDKRERLVDDEVQANNEQIELSASVMLKAREEACELINKLFPELKVSVRMRTQEELKKLMEEGGINDKG